MSRRAQPALAGRRAARRRGRRRLRLDAAWRAAAAPRAPGRRRAAPAPVGVGALGRVEPASRIRKLDPARAAWPSRGSSGCWSPRATRVRGRPAAGRIRRRRAEGRRGRPGRGARSPRRARSLDRTRAAGRPSEIAAQRARIEALRRCRRRSRRREAERAERLVPHRRRRRRGGRPRALRRRPRRAPSAPRPRPRSRPCSRPRPEDVALAEARARRAPRPRWPGAGRCRPVARARADRRHGPAHHRPPRRPGRHRRAARDRPTSTRMDVVADVYETDLPRLRLGAPAEIVVPGEARRFPATVREIGWRCAAPPRPAPTPSPRWMRRTVEVRLGLSDGGGARRCAGGPTCRSRWRSGHERDAPRRSATACCPGRRELSRATRAAPRRGAAPRRPRGAGPARSLA